MSIDWGQLITLEDKKDLEAQQQRAQFKAERDSLVKSIVVVSSLGRAFNGDELSTTRMFKHIKVLEAKEPEATVEWILADNSIAQVGLAELLEVLDLSITKQSELWVPSVGGAANE